LISLQIKNGKEAVMADFEAVSKEFSKNHGKSMKKLFWTTGLQA
jgi:hypothetical protein